MKKQLEEFLADSNEVPAISDFFSTLDPFALSDEEISSQQVVINGIVRAINRKWD